MSSDDVRFNRYMARAHAEWEAMSMDERVNAVWDNAEDMAATIQECLHRAAKSDKHIDSGLEYDPNDIPMWRSLAAWINRFRENWCEKRAEDLEDNESDVEYLEDES